MKLRHFKKLTILLILVLAGSFVASCNHSDDSSGSLVIYSGRNETLIAPLIESWEEVSGINVEVRYDNSTTLALTLDREGARTPADIFISQSPGALGFLSAKNLLSPISNDVLSKLQSEFQASDATWIGLSGRQRVLVYNTNLVSEDELPSSIAELTQELYKGRVAVAPNNSSFQDFITALQFAWGKDATEEWLQGMAANNAPNYAKNSAIVSAVMAGEVEMGLVNHYYLLRALAENPNAPAKNHYFPSDDIGSLLIITAAGITESSNNKTAAEQFLNYMTDQMAQEYFVRTIQEYSLLPDIPAPDGVPNLDSFILPDLANLILLGAELEDTIALIENSGIIR